MSAQFVNLYFRPCPCSVCNGEKTLHTRTIRRHLKRAPIVTAPNALPQIITKPTCDNVQDPNIHVPPVTDATDATDATGDMHTLPHLPLQPLDVEFDIHMFLPSASDDALAVTENALSSIPESTLNDLDDSLHPEDNIEDDLLSVSIVSLSDTTTASSTDDKDLECRRRLYLWSTRSPSQEWQKMTFWPSYGMLHFQTCRWTGEHSKMDRKQTCCSATSTLKNHWCMTMS